MLNIEYRPLKQVMGWSDNPKLHDIGSIIASIQRYGFRDAIIYDQTLGSIVAGNGRLEALNMMYQKNYDPPEGIQVDEDGEWLIPVQVGIDSKTVQEAVAFAIDHNNIGLSFAFSQTDLARLYDDNYANILTDNGVSLVTVTKEDAARLKDMIAPPMANDQLPANEQANRTPMPIVLKVRMKKGMRSDFIQNTDELIKEYGATIK